MPAKTPIYLKTTTPKKGKKLKLRDVLSGDMISPPLGDVRHSAHVGPEGEGDMFGDVGFLRGKMDMLPVLGRPQNGGGRSHDDGFSAQREAPGYDGFHYQQHANGRLKSTVSLPVFVTHEQAPPKPPRLHLDDPAPPEPGRGGRADDSRLLSLCEDGEALGSEPFGDASPSPAVRSLVPSSGSLSEASSEDSASEETCGPPDVHRGLSLDSDAGLSNEDAGSERSESPCASLSPAGLPPSSGVPRSDSMAVLDLDLGPSILEDVLSIMDRYKTVDNRCEL